MKKKILQLNPVKPTYDPHQPRGWLHLQPERLTDYASKCMPPVLLTGPTVVYCSLELAITSLVIAMTITSTGLIVLIHKEIARLSWLLLNTNMNVYPSQ